jgi:large subunit ribosomal protein L25
MATVNLSASARTDTGKGVARSLRRSGQIPAIIYGHAREAQSLAIDAKDLDRLLGTIAAESTVIELAVDGGRATKTLIREIQRHPFKRQILHVDFQELVAGEKVTVSIPLVLVGIPDAVRLEGGVMDQVMRELEIEVDPSNIPNHIDVDVSHLEMGHSLHVSDVQLPAGVTVLDDPETTVCVVSVPRAAIETPAAGVEAVAEVAEPEVIRAKKDDDDAEGGDDKK